MKTNKISSNELRSLIESEVKKSLLEYGQDEPGGGVPGGLENSVSDMNQKVKGRIEIAVDEKMMNELRLEKYETMAARIVANILSSEIDAVSTSELLDLGQEETDASMELYYSVAGALTEYANTIAQEWLQKH